MNEAIDRVERGRLDRSLPRIICIIVKNDLQYSALFSITFILL
jgi:hypothetical protein